MKTIIATLKESPTLSFEESVKKINNGRTDSTYFYVSGDEVSLSSPFYRLDEKRQKEALIWLLEGLSYELN